LQGRDKVLPAGLQSVRSDRHRFQGLVAFQKFKTLRGRENLEEQLDEERHVAKVVAQVPGQLLHVVAARSTLLAALAEVAQNSDDFVDALQKQGHVRGQS
jgi:hypothetical protein